MVSPLEASSAYSAHRNRHGGAYKLSARPAGQSTEVAVRPKLAPTGRAHGSTRLTRCSARLTRRPLVAEAREARPMEAMDARRSWMRGVAFPSAFPSALNPSGRSSTVPCAKASSGGGGSAPYQKCVLSQRVTPDEPPIRAKAQQSRTRKTRPTMRRMIHSGNSSSSPASCPRMLSPTKSPPSRSAARVQLHVSQQTKSAYSQNAAQLSVLSM
mmetsp:Transcript_23028/g.65926  ORF Transcript_23028/g.65926 Transcript_23028/m.65926 type:complete len:213 (+) Transcript_23028:310-948(+)